MNRSITQSFARSLNTSMESVGAIIGTVMSSADAVASASEELSSASQQIAAGASDGPAPDPALVGKVADAFCACHDAACLVGVGETYRFELETLFASGASTDPQGIAAEKRLQECGDRLSGGKK